VFPGQEVVVKTLIAVFAVVESASALHATMSVAQPLLDTIEPDEPLESSINTKRSATAPVVLTPTNATQNDPESGQSRQTV
jgi:hypothetical protein